MAGTAMDLEKRTREIGEEIFARARAAEPSVLRPDWWLGRLLDWSTGEPRRKVQLFRFIDTLPMLRTDEEIVGHLAEYLLQDDVPLPRPFARMLRSAAGGAWYTPRLASMTRASSLRMARRFIAGATAEEALQTVQRLRSQHMAFSLDLLGEATNSSEQADWYARQYMELIPKLAPAVAAWSFDPQLDDSARGPMPRLNLSLKLTSLDPNYDTIAPERSTERVLEQLRPILRLARRHGAFINVDMEQYEYKDLTFGVFRRVLDEPEFRDFADVGIVLQAYLRDSEQDAARLLRWVEKRGTPIAVRLVKGAYWDYEVYTAIQRNWSIPVWTHKWESDAAFERIARRLIDARALVRPALASHNVRSLASALAYAEVVGADRREYEIQMLFGMGDPLKFAVAGMGHTLRVYTPFGELIPGMAYLIRRLLENTSNESFLKHSFSDRRSPERLLADPAMTRPESPPIPQPVHEDPEETDMQPFRPEPLTDFARQDARHAMQAALEQVRSCFAQRYPIVISDQMVETAQILESVNPSDTQAVVGRVCMGDASHVEMAVAAARGALATWSLRSASERAGMLRRVADVLRRRRFELAAWIIYEVGKPWREADADVAEAIDFCEFYGREMERLESRPRRRDYPGERNSYVYSPRGVTVVISPWNFPLAILAGMTTAAVAAGNTVIMKPAEQSPVVAAKLMEVFAEAGLPPGVVNYLPGEGETVGAALVNHPLVSVIAFTGSREVGIKIYEAGARWRPGQPELKRVIAEMGGKNAIIVDADADLDEAVAGVVASAFGYCGQKCSACSRVIVLRSVADEFTRRLVEATRSIPVGPADAPDTVIGPLVDEGSCRKTLSYIEHGQREGRLVYRGSLNGLESRGYFVPPTIFAGVDPRARIAQEEIFGPVLAVIAADSFTQAIAIADGTDYALTGGLYSRSPAHIERAKREFHVGNLYINRGTTGALVDRQPFGGLRLSGVGSKAGGPDYLLQFLEPRTITENTMRHGFAPVDSAESQGAGAGTTVGGF